MDITNSVALESSAASDILPAKTPSKLHDAAQQFEALMIGEMMRSVRESGSEGWMGSGGDTGDDSAMDMAENQFAKALSMSGGLGLSKMIEQSVSAQHPESQNVAATRENGSAGSEK